MRLGPQKDWQKDDIAMAVPDMMQGQTATRVNPKLLEILVCPVTKTALEYDQAAQELISRAARLAYPIRDGIPIMLPEEARTIE